MRRNPCVLGTPFSRVKYPPKRAKKGVFCIEDKEQKYAFLGVKRGQKEAKNDQNGCFSLEDKDKKYTFLGVKRGQKQSKNGQKRGVF